jgi:tetratricopeptide (TPR) repeat protein
MLRLVIFLDRDYSHAFEKFSLAINLCKNACGEMDDLAVLYLNRSICNLRLEDFESSFADANTAIQYEPNYVKAYYFRSLSQIGLKKFPEATMDMRFIFLL